MGLFGNNTDDLETRVARLEAHVAALMPLLDSGQGPTIWQQQAEPAAAEGWPSLPVVDADIARIVAKGNKIEAIKVAREKYGLGLKEAKDYVEGMPDLR
ncbi:MAG: ribosomal protein L7/L12 [Propionibacteriaceae bacterium]